MITSSCVKCGKLREYKYKSWVKANCSYSCSNTGKTGTGLKLKIKCIVCNKEKFYPASEYSQRTGKYCSIQCAGKHRAELKDAHTEAVCNVCSAKFKIRKDKVNEKGNYCSNDCGAKTKTKFSIWSEITPDMEKRRQYFREYISNNREKINELSAVWGKNNRTYKNYIQQISRAAGVLTYKQWQEIINNNKKCSHCGVTERLEVDHILATSEGGKTELSNLQVLCRSCNASKGGINRKRKLMKFNGFEVTEL